MRRLVVLTMTAALTWGVPATTGATPAPRTDRAGAPSAAAKNPKCVTPKEYRKVKKGMGQSKVNRIIGGKGRLTSSSGGMKVRRYEACKGSPYYAQVTFKKRKVYTKYGYFG